MKKFFLITASLVLISSSALADKEEKIKELIDLSFGSQTQLEKGLSQPLQKQIDEIMCHYVMNKTQVKQAETRLGNLLQTQDFTNTYVRFFMDHYTEEEIDELLKIYHTPVLQKAKDLQPRLDEYLKQSQNTFARTIMPAVKNIDSELGVKYKKRPAEEYAGCLKMKAR